MSSFRIYLAEPNADETAALLAWSAPRLAELERWAVRRQVRIPAPLLAEVRRRYAEDAGDPALGPAWDRDVTRLPASRSPMSPFLASFERDLRMYAASLAEGRIDDLTVTIAPGIPAVFLATTRRRLFLPDWLAALTTDRLFAPTPLFPDPPPATLSWLFFQSLVLTPPGVATGPAAQVLRIRESD